MKSRVLAAASALAAAGVLVLALRCVWWRSGAGDSRSFATPPHDRSGPAPQQSPAGGAGKARAPAASVETEWPVRFRDVTGECGITFEHRDGSSGRHFTPETMSAGVATFDYDGDGLIDIYFPNGAALPGVRYDPPPRHALYKNLGGWRFRDVTVQAGIACTAFGLGIAVADYDNDGRPDIYLDNFGPNVLYHNNGDGTFTDATLRAGVPGTIAGGRLEKKVGAGACFFDIDGDGLLDLYAGNYIEIDLASYVTPMKGKYGFIPSPTVYAPVPGTLYRNGGDGTFTDVSRASGIAASRGRCMGVTAADYDNDGNADLFVCNDVSENFLFHNDGGGKFQQVGLVAGIALNINGEGVANMAVDAGDYNHDGWLDFYVTDYDKQFPLLFQNLGGVFSEVMQSAKAGAGCYPHVKWGCGLVDFDNDGYKDIFIALGHTDDNVGFVDSTTAYRCRNVLLKNLGNGKFADVSAESGILALEPHAARGVAFDDLDNDGDIDVVILNSRQRPTVLRNMLNEQGCKNHWLDIRLQGVKTNRDGVGARVRVVAGGLSQIDEVHSGRGYQSHWGTRLHFGLGRHDRVDRVEVHWIGGGADVLENLAPDRQATILEGSTH
ncbi:MAG: CRTAC1 family protein [Thermoguttaceae bacterium]